MVIAVLGWGSLIWDPRNLEIEGDWRTDGPSLPVEFARVSNGDRLTLVIVEGAPLQPTLWARSRKESLQDAVRNLQQREGLPTARRIGSWSTALPQYTAQGPIARAVSNWARTKGVDGVVWTALGPKRPDGINGNSSEDELLAYLRELESSGRSRAAREYIEKAPTQIDTRLRKRIRDELGWS